MLHISDFVKACQILALLVGIPCVIAAAETATNNASSCRRNPFNRDTAPPLTIAATDWHCEACKPSQFARAGCPQEIRAHAQLSNTCHYSGWWTGGGGQLFGGDAPCFAEGTWGWDYLGLLNQKRVWLDWNHGTRQQAGVGAYRTDGPKAQWHK